LILALTGSTGYLGRHLVGAAISAGHQVRALIRPSAEPPPCWSAAGVTVARIDVEQDATGAADLLAGADVFFHLAAAGVQSRDRSWERLVAVNAIMPVNWVRVAAEARVPRVVFAGTCLEYTGHGSLPHAPWPPTKGLPRCRESSQIETGEPYGASKAAGGIVARAAARAVGLPMWYLRLASVYGPGDDPAKLLPHVLATLRGGSKIDLSPGEQVREWLHLDDAILALLAAAAAKPRGVEVVNVGTGRGVRLRDVVSGLVEAVGGDPTVLDFGARPYRSHEAHYLTMTTSRATKRFGWRARTGLTEGLSDLAARETAGRLGERERDLA
jgi:nucleoside-diphosphate-sugar epimerase